MGYRKNLDVVIVFFQLCIVVVIVIHLFSMTQSERWNTKYNEVVYFIRTNHRNPSKYIPEERGKYYNWLHHNRQLLNSGALREDRVEKFKELLAKVEENKHVNQYQ